MEKQISNIEQADKKSYAGIPEAEFVVRCNTFILISNALQYILKIYVKFLTLL